MNLDKLHVLIRRFEGLRLKPYMCPAGVPTIGYGSTRYPHGRAVAMSDRAITKDDAESFMQYDAERFALEAIKLSPVLADDDDKLCAIADFIYNLGASRYAASTLRRRVNAQDWDGAQVQIMKWVWAGGKKLPGLVTRRSAEAELLQEGREMA